MKEITLKSSYTATLTFGTHIMLLGAFPSCPDFSVLGTFQALWHSRKEHKASVWGALNRSWLQPVLWPCGSLHSDHHTWSGWVFWISDSKNCLCALDLLRPATPLRNPSEHCCPVVAPQLLVWTLNAVLTNRSNSWGEDCIGSSRCLTSGTSNWELKWLLVFILSDVLFSTAFLLCGDLIGKD